METKKEFKQLFQKFIDKTISPEELEKFYNYVNNPDNNAQFLELLTELMSYIEFSANPESHHAGEKGLAQLQNRIRLMDTLLKGNTQEQKKIANIFRKIANICRN